MGPRERPRPHRVAAHAFGARSVGVRRVREDVPGRVRVEVRERVDEQRGAVAARRTGTRAQDDGRTDVGQARPHVDARAQEAVAEPQPDGGVVVARCHDDVRVLGEPRHRVREQGDGVDRRDRAVVDVARDDDRVDRLGAGQLHEVVEVRGLVLQQVDPVQGAPEVPVGGVQDAHARTVPAGSHSPGDPERRRARGCQTAPTTSIGPVEAPLRSTGMRPPMPIMSRSSTMLGAGSRSTTSRPSSSPSM